MVGIALAGGIFTQSLPVCLVVLAVNKVNC